jgi:hypothetical protein
VAPKGILRFAISVVWRKADEQPNKLTDDQISGIALIVKQDEAPISIQIGFFASNGIMIYRITPTRV